MTPATTYTPPRASRRRAAPRARHAQTGVGLVEILIAVLVLGLGLLGAAAMQSLALRNSQSALERSQAVVQAYAMADAMRANSVAAKAGSYNTATPLCYSASAGSAGGDADLAAADRAAWVQSLGASLGATASTCGRIACAAELCTIEVIWDDTRGGNAGGESDADKRTFRLQVRL